MWSLVLSPACVCAQSFGRVRLVGTPRTVAGQALQSMGFSWQEYWSGLPFPGIEPMSPAPPALAGRFFTSNRVVLLLLKITGKVCKVSYASVSPLGIPFWPLIHGSQAQKASGAEGAVSWTLRCTWTCLHLCGLSVTKHPNLPCIASEKKKTGHRRHFCVKYLICLKDYPNR